MELLLNIAAGTTVTAFSIRNMWLCKMKILELAILYVTLFLALLPGAVIGQFSSFTIIAGICLYGLFIDRTNRLQNICMGLSGYIISVVINNMTSGIYSLLRGEFLQNYAYFWVLTVPVMFAATYVITRVLGKWIRTKVQSSKEIYKIRQIWYLADATLLLCAAVFAFNNAAGERAGYSAGIVFFNCLLFLVYFVITTLLLVSIFQTYRENIQAGMKQEAFRDLQAYTGNLETMYENLRRFKHDYINILTSMSGYMEQEDMPSLRVFFEAKILPTRTQIMEGDYRLNQLSNIRIIELKSLLSAKMIYAHESGIDVTIDIPAAVTHLDMDTIDLVRVPGIFCDNAIEAALETQQPKVGLCMIRNPKTTAVIITNSFRDDSLPLHQLQKHGFTTKTGHSGIGLSNARDILSAYEHVLLETAKNNGLFSQYMEIPIEKEV